MILGVAHNHNGGRVKTAEKSDSDADDENGDDARSLIHSHRCVTPGGHICHRRINAPTALTALRDLSDITDSSVRPAAERVRAAACTLGERAHEHAGRDGGRGMHR